MFATASIERTRDTIKTISSTKKTVMNIVTRETASMTSRKSPTKIRRRMMTRKPMKISVPKTLSMYPKLRKASKPLRLVACPRAIILALGLTTHA